MNEFLSATNDVKPSLNKDISRVSIGMPVYNGEEFIREALDSLLAQTVTDFELIISDNASTDNTQAICEKYTQQDSRISYFRQKENIGAAANFQFVLDNAKSDFFMWAACDDKWAKSFLQEALLLLEDADISFIFPTFEVRSIKLHLGKKFNKDIYKFIESKNRMERVLQFVNLHHYSHKCNIVYSVFRTEFLRAACKQQSIANDGAFGAVVLGQGRGKILNNVLFSKRYAMYWPGALSSLHALLAYFYKNRLKDFELAKDAALDRLNILFPEYFDEIKIIFENYHMHTCGKFYQICSTDNLLNRLEKQ